MTIDQHVAHGEVLRHPNNCVVHGLVAVWVVLADDVTHDTSRLFIRAIPVVAELMHRKQHTSVHRLEAIPRVRQGATHDNAHGVIEVAPAHFLFETDGQGFFGELSHGAVVSGGVKSNPVF